MNTPSNGDFAAEKCAHIEALISHYPDVSPEEKQLLMHWFRKEASSYDVAMISQRDDLQAGYAQIRTELHSLGLGDWIMSGTIICGVVTAVLTAIYFSMP